MRFKNNNFEELTNQANKILLSFLEIDDKFSTLRRLLTNKFVFVSEIYCKTYATWIEVEEN